MDTNIISELSKSPPNPSVLNWLGEIDEENLYLSVISIAEIQRGIEKLPDSKRKRMLGRWKHDLMRRFNPRIISIDIDIANEWGSLIAESEKKGERMEAADGLIAATAAIHRLTLVTRNTSDFSVTGLLLFNPIE
ncbi:MAG: type II toxin-antitoxin system VapC family toxin [Chloroflexota bacterium]